ncbi:MAG: hypothetical protein KGL74_14285 [Elusimicrobia bacterium]|nr:hypothetical protein [Elusimicrobiota bacterium]MDE2512289.1 hypothetical protein [Elusimicrobiota bacterium]
MKRVMIAAFMIFAAAPSRAKDYYFPPLPVSIGFAPDGSSPFCASSELRSRLTPYFLSFDPPSGGLPPDLTLRCEAYDGDRVKFTVFDGAGNDVDHFKVKVIPRRETYDSTAFLAARALATGKKTLRAALQAYRADIRYSAAKLGSDDFAAGNWNDAAYRLYRALEGDAPAEPLYFGLYASHAKLGHAAQARWYLMAFCKASGKRPTRLTDRQLAYLRAMPSHDPSDPLPGPVDLSEWRRRRDARQWGAAIDELKSVIERAPWAVAAYDALADSYQALGWGPLEDDWRERAKIARKVSNDKNMQKDLLDALQSP